MTLSNASRKRACVSRDAIVPCLREGRLVRTVRSCESGVNPIAVQNPDEILTLWLIPRCSGPAFQRILLSLCRRKAVTGPVSLNASGDDATAS